LIAPGFARRQSLFSEDFDVWQLPILFVKNLTIFSIDLLTHPMIYLLFIAGFSVSSMFRFRMNDAHLLRLFLLLSSYLLLTSLGSSFAYPAWHQNLGVIPIVSLFSLQLGIRARGRLSPLNSKVLLFLYVVVICFILSRVSLEVSNRAAVWDSNLTVTSQETPLIKFESAEITYPPFGLGIEDIGTWKWMSESYSEWVANFNSNDKGVLD
jgi:hypothetical protein